MHWEDQIWLQQLAANDAFSSARNYHKYDQFVSRKVKRTIFMSCEVEFMIITTATKCIVKLLALKVR